MTRSTSKLTNSEDCEKIASNNKSKGPKLFPVFSKKRDLNSSDTSSTKPSPIKSTRSRVVRGTYKTPDKVPVTQRKLVDMFKSAPKLTPSARLNIKDTDDCLHSVDSIVYDHTDQENIDSIHIPKTINEAENNAADETIAAEIIESIYDSMEEIAVESITADKAGKSISKKSQITVTNLKMSLNIEDLTKTLPGVLKIPDVISGFNFKLPTKLNNSGKSQQKDQGSNTKAKKKGGGLLPINL